MSTRSTVSIDGIKLYRHHDGYPLGMARALHDVITEQGSITPNTMLKTQSHNFQLTDSIYDGPPNYHYKIVTNQNNGLKYVETYQVGYNDDNDASLIFVNKKELSRFINFEFDKVDDKDYECIRTISLWSNRFHYTTRKSLLSEIKSHWEEFPRWIASGSKGNASSLVGNIARLYLTAGMWDEAENVEIAFNHLWVDIDAIRQDHLAKLERIEAIDTDMENAKKKEHDNKG